MLSRKIQRVFWLHCQSRGTSRHKLGTIQEGICQMPGKNIASITAHWCASPFCAPAVPRKQLLSSLNFPSSFSPKLSEPDCHYVTTVPAVSVGECIQFSLGEVFDQTVHLLGFAHHLQSLLLAPSSCPCVQEIQKVLPQLLRQSRLFKELEHVQQSLLGSKLDRLHLLLELLDKLVPLCQQRRPGLEQNLHGFHFLLRNQQVQALLCTSFLLEH